MKKPNYNHTLYACFAGFVIQAIVNIFVPLLFVTFRSEFSLPLSKISLLITANFAIQLATDLAATYFVDKIGYRASAVIAHVLCAAGLIMLTFLPNLTPSPFIGLAISVMVYGIGGGLIEVIASPMVESCPTPNKETAMSLLHSFYCWGSVGVIALSTAFFYVFGIHNWRIVSLIWSIVPIINAIVFLKVPIFTLESSEEKRTPVHELFTSRLFLIFVVLMVCAGACEIAVTQWASTYVEKQLGVAKSIGDIAGPMMFAVLAGVSRTFYAKFGEKIDLWKYIMLSGILCVFSYLLIALSPFPIIGIIGCALCGFSIGCMWPGTYSIASKNLRGGTGMFALLALAGDLGCSAGPGLVGFVSSIKGDNLKAGFLAGTVFPIILIIFLLLQRRETRKGKAAK